MVKLFVGNLAESVDSNRLKQIFKPFTNIIDCDVVKNYAFITIPDEDKSQVMSRMDGYNIDGKPIQVKLSTSKLKSQSSVPTGCCLRCASSDHKTPNCPDDPKNKVKETLLFDLTGSGIKRTADGSFIGAPEAKRATSDQEKEIPQPPEQELQQLYEEYRLARQRYTYYKERLIKEIEAKRGPGTAYLVFPTTGQTVAGTQLSSGPISYQADVYTIPAVVAAAPYNTPLKAPYGNASSTSTPKNAPYAATSSNTMTPAQYLQQIQSSKVSTLTGAYPNAIQGAASPSVAPTPPVAPYSSQMYGTSSNNSWLPS